MNTKIMSYRNFDNFFKRIEKQNMKKNRTSLTWVTMLNHSNKAILENYIDEKTLSVDVDKLNELKKEFMES